MDKIIMHRYNDAFSLLLDELDKLGKEYKLSELYEVLLPWDFACEEVFPPLNLLFIKTGGYTEYKSWKEMEGVLPFLSVLSIEEDRVELQISEKLMHDFVLLLLAEYCGADIEMISDEEMVPINPFLGIIDPIWEQDGYRCETKGKIVTLAHV